MERFTFDVQSSIISKYIVSLKNSKQLNQYMYLPGLGDMAV